MPKYHFCAQYSDEYDALKLGKPSSSNFRMLFTKPSQTYPKGRPSKAWLSLAMHCISERMLGRKVDSFTSAEMERGLQQEPEAVRWYEWERGIETKQIGVILTDDGKVACSPDRLVGDDGLLEIKCPRPAGQAGYLLIPDAKYKHWPQLQGQLLISERKWVDLLPWHGEMDRPIIRVERDEEYIEYIELQLREINKYLDTVSDKIHTMSKAPLVERVRQTLESPD